MLLRPDEKHYRFRHASSVKPPASSSGGDVNALVQYDSKVAVEFMQVMENLATINKLHKESASTRGELCDKFVMLKFSD
jgi:hypothetical protein